MSEPIVGDFEVSKQVFNQYRWFTYKNRNSKFHPNIEKSAEIANPADVLKGVFGVSVEDSEELQVYLAQIESAKTALHANVGKIALISRPGGWADQTQSRVRLFSPQPSEENGPILDFSVNTKTKKGNGFRGWDTFLRLNGISTVYDIWYEGYEAKHTSIQLPQFRTLRKYGGKVVETSFNNPLSDFEIIDDSEQVRSVLRGSRPSRPDSADELIEMVEGVLAEQQIPHQPTTFQVTA